MVQDTSQKLTTGFFILMGLGLNYQKIAMKVKKS